MKNENPDEDIFEGKETRVQYSIRIAPFLKNKLDRHIKTLKYLNHPEKSHQTWILNAINEKIERDEGSDHLPKEKYLSVTLKDSIREKLDERLEEISQIISSYSKKKWILEAIEEQLEEEKEQVQEKLAEYRSGNKR